MISAKDARAIKDVAQERLAKLDNAIRQAAGKGKSTLDVVLNCYEKELLESLGYAPTKIDDLTRIFF